jgi:uncharacterized coiled-coil DUF342 family protein
MPTKNNTQETAPELPQDKTEAAALVASLKAESDQLNADLEAAILGLDRKAAAAINDRKKGLTFDLIGAEIHLEKMKLQEIEAKAEAYTAEREAISKKMYTLIERIREVEAERNLAGSINADLNNRLQMLAANRGQSRQRIGELETQLKELISAEMSHL